MAAAGRAAVNCGEARMIRALPSAIMRATTRNGSIRVRPVGMNFRAGLAVALTAAALAGCSGFGKKHDVVAVDPNAYPANYRTEIVAFLRQSLANRSDFRGAMIAPPALKPVGGSEPHYVVCVQFNPRSQIKLKVAVFLDGRLSQFVDAAPEQCSDAVFAPFKELDAAMPSA